MDLSSEQMEVLARGCRTLAFVHVQDSDELGVLARSMIELTGREWVIPECGCEPDTTGTAIKYCAVHACALETLKALERAHRFMFRCESNGGSTEGQSTTLREECANTLGALDEAKRSS